MKKLLILASLICLGSLQAEIQSVVVRWRERSCNENCVVLLNDSFKEVKEIESFTVSNLSGTINIKWKKYQPFSYKAIKRPMQRVGVGLYDIAVVVRGRINATKDRVELVSEGDNTSFELVSYRPEEPAGKYLKLDDNILKSIQENSATHKTFIVEGTLYQPHKEPPLYLLVDKVHAEEAPKSK